LNRGEARPAPPLRDPIRRSEYGCQSSSSRHVALLGIRIPITWSNVTSIGTCDGIQPQWSRCRKTRSIRSAASSIHGARRPSCTVDQMRRCQSVISNVPDARPFFKCQCTQPGNRFSVPRRVTRMPRWAAVASRKRSISLQSALAGTSISNSSRKRHPFDRPPSVVLAVLAQGRPSRQSMAPLLTARIAAIASPVCCRNAIVVQ
jgi:hypothetical protein